MPRYMTRTRAETIYNKTLDAATCVITGITEEPLDGTLVIGNTADPTKHFVFALAGATAAKTLTFTSSHTDDRTITLPDATTTLVGTDTTQTLTLKTLTSPKVGTAICDTAGNELFKVTATASAVNEFTVTNAAATTSPVLSATGGDTHINWVADAKGTAAIVLLDPLVQKATGAAVTTAGAETITVAQILGGIVLRDPNGDNRTDTTCTAAELVAGIPEARVGMCFRLTYINNADAAETITIAAGAGGTLKGRAAQTTIAQNGAKELLFVLTTVTASSEAFDLYVR